MTKAVRERRKFNLPPRPSSTLDIYRLPSPLISCKGQDCERKKQHCLLRPYPPKKKKRSAPPPPPPPLSSFFFRAEPVKPNLPSLTAATTHCTSPEEKVVQVLISGVWGGSEGVLGWVEEMAFGTRRQIVQRCTQRTLCTHAARYSRFPKSIDPKRKGKTSLG